MNALEQNGFLLERKLSGKRPDHNFKVQRCQITPNVSSV